MSSSILSAAGRSLAPFLSNTVLKLRLTRSVTYFERYLAFLTGRGSGSGWDSKGEAKSISRFINSDSPVILDVGANNGQWALELSTYLTERAEVYLFECADYCFPGLELRFPNIPNPHLVKKAVSDHTGTMDFYVTKEASGCGSAYERDDVSIVQYSYDKVVVDTITLDDFCTQKKIERVDFLKMDIEGHEYAALLGATNLLSERKISALSFEFGSGNVNSRTFFRDFWELLTKYEYNIYRVIPGGKISPRLKSYSEEFEYFRGATNYIASTSELSGK